MAELLCAIHRYHSPRPQESDLHHVLPKSWGGPNTDANIIPICQTGHANVHRLLTALRRYDGVVAWELRRQFGPGERAIADRGYAAWLATQ